MTEQERLQLEIDRGVADLIEGVAVDEARARLNELLLGNPSLQDYYARAMRLHLLLQHEMCYSAFSPRFSVVPIDEPALPVGEQTQCCVTLASRMSSDRAGAACRQERRESSGTTWATAVVACLVLIAAVLLWWQPGDRQMAVHSDLGPGGEATEDIAAPIKGGTVVKGGILFRGRQVLNTVSQLTSTDEIDSILLPYHTKSSPLDVTPCSGPAWIGRTLRGLERAYLVVLEPNWRMDVYVTADAVGGNALSMVETDSTGQVTGRWRSYHNFSGKDSGNQDITHGGYIGECSVRNTSSESKYFIFAGSYLRISDTLAKTWHQSDCKLQVETARLMAIGWDDSGYASDFQFDPETASADHDYNDMVALVRLVPPLSEPEEHGLTYTPAPAVKAEIAEDVGSGCRVEVKPGQDMVIVASSDAYYQNGMRIVELPTGRVLWEDMGAPVEIGKSQPANRGVYVVSNHTEMVREYELQGLSRSHYTDDQWQASDYAIIDESPGHMVLGFEDRPFVEEELDWADIRMSIHWLTD